MEKNDPRVKRTRRLLGNALVSLILEKAYEQITIKDITDRAEVAYITFFRHYDSIDELLMQVLGNGMAACAWKLRSWLPRVLPTPWMQKVL